MRTITAANAIYMLGIETVFPTPQRLKEFSADDVYSTDEVELAQTEMGVDGNLAAGYVFNEVKQKIMLQASSAAVRVFEAWNAQQIAASDLYAANGEVTLPGLSQKFIMTRGILKAWVPIPDAAKVLKRREFTITWGRIEPAPV